MGDILNLVFQKVNTQISSGVVDSGWINLLTSQLESLLANTTSNNTLKEVLQDALSIVSTNKDQVSSLGIAGFTLFLQQLSIGDNNSAIETFIRTQATAQQIINEIISGSADIVDAKKRIDALTAQGLSLLETIGIDAAKMLLPILIAMI